MADNDDDLLDVDAMSVIDLLRERNHRLQWELDLANLRVRNLMGKLKGKETGDAA